MFTIKCIINVNFFYSFQGDKNLRRKYRYVRYVLIVENNTILNRNTYS